MCLNDGSRKGVKSVINLLFAAYTGDVSALRSDACKERKMVKILSGYDTLLLLSWHFDDPKWQQEEILKKGALLQFALSSIDMEQRDYDSRTALHVAAAEGHTEVVHFLLEACKVNPVPRDRWGNTPMDEAVHFGHHDVVTILQQHHDRYSPHASSDDTENAEKSLDSLL